MHRYARVGDSKKYLVDDDIVELTFRGCRFSYRLRVWRSHGGPAIVLASQLPSGAPPSWLRSKLANLVYQAYLCFPEQRMLYFELSLSPSKRVVQIVFEDFGHGHRRRLFRPAERSLCWREFQTIVGSAVTE